MTATVPADSVDHRPLILTARLDAAAAGQFETLRRAHFPSARNQVPAHVSLFHQLPGSMIDEIISHLRAVARAQPVIDVEVAPPRSLGNGVAFDLRSAALTALHAELAAEWAGLIIAPDRVRLRAHVTVQNKVDAATARATLAQLGAGFVPWHARITGVSVWRYLDGPWQPLRDIGFRG